MPGPSLLYYRINWYGLFCVSCIFGVSGFIVGFVVATLRCIR